MNVSAYEMVIGAGLFARPWKARGCGYGPFDFRKIFSQALAHGVFAAARRP